MLPTRQLGRAAWQHTRTLLAARSIGHSAAVCNSGEEEWEDSATVGVVRGLLATRRWAGAAC